MISIDWTRPKRSWTQLLTRRMKWWCRSMARMSSCTTVHTPCSSISWLISSFLNLKGKNSMNLSHRSLLWSISSNQICTKKVNSQLKIWEMESNLKLNWQCTFWKQWLRLHHLFGRQFLMTSTKSLRKTSIPHLMDSKRRKNSRTRKPITSGTSRRHIRACMMISNTSSTMCCDRPKRSERWLTWTNNGPNWTRICLISMSTSKRQSWKRACSSSSERRSSSLRNSTQIKLQQTRLLEFLVVITTETRLKT